ncbi:MAG TPA: DUF5996 family protein [Conexibacter sp.]|nr:DUF5996 family protein [Conexibacter sp.]
MAAALSAWPALPSYRAWADTCDTLHAHAQVLGKLAAALAPHEPGFQHLALRLTARGWETLPLPAPNGSGAFVAALDLHTHHVVLEHSGGATRRIALMPDRTVGAVARRVLTAVGELAGAVRIDPAPQEVHWSVPLDEDDQHATYDPHAVAGYLRAATHAALALAAFRAPHAERATPVNAWWGSFDLAVSVFAESGASAVTDADAREVAVGWWPGDPRNPEPAFYAYAKPAPDGIAEARLEPGPHARWNAELGEFVLEHAAVAALPDPHEAALAFARSALVRFSDLSVR